MHVPYVSMHINFVAAAGQEALTSGSGSGEIWSAGSTRAYSFAVRC
jgi:hypothetical protein